MARKTETTAEPAPLVECFVAHAVTDPEMGIPIVVGHGTKWRSDSLPVRLNAAFFHGEGLAEPERPSWTAFVQQPAPAPVPSSPPAGARPRGLTTGS